ncbi:4-deoxy-L-threo-5-hexosulose-uronate ketol-isomerase [Zobellia uliginosa]|uniref:4-deoxy-L-threo-5-hexosulose-uronate ketol-isomerase n=1 Tax=Zobellia uliginosa TaxID=143224 RepID=A0ABY1L1B8_9FLAO|nr:5-dehydro-4-deoxy-D-glucuronate isomerase [Zobellia uliginosa]SIT08645.1 4-deoxy-L-threo-5-hexosulose-uronate ketol-isomerase [Zobellia uliginosa]
MKSNFKIRYATHPDDAKTYDTQRLRKDFLVNDIFTEDEVNLTYSHYDRFIMGGAMPVHEKLQLESIPFFATEYFLQKKEMGIINLGQKGKVIADGQIYELEHKDALYLGSDVKDVSFESEEASKPAKFYLNACIAHKALPSKLISFADAPVLELGTTEESNKRRLYQHIVPHTVETCQLMMGITSPELGNAWNTMPAHVHELRMEAYFYFDIPEGKAAAHIMGQPQETRILWVANEQAVISPPWSIHCAAGTSPYSFIWGMAGDDDPIVPYPISELQ